LTAPQGALDDPEARRTLNFWCAAEVACPSRRGSPAPHPTTSPDLDQPRPKSRRGFKTPEQGAQTTLYAATSPKLTPRSAGGKFLRECACHAPAARVVRSSTGGDSRAGLVECRCADAEQAAVTASDLSGLGYRDEELAAALWREAERLTGEEFRVVPLM
jgi:hypothetical protein